MIPNDVGPNDISRSARTLRDPRFTGAFTAIITPFTADGARIDYARLEQQIDRQKSGGVTGVVVCGTTGESPTLTEGEYRELVERTIALCKDRGLLTIVGTGSNSTAHAVHLHKQAASAGADGSLSVNPYYNKPTQEGLYRHFATVADSADLPVMLYNIPGRTGVALTPETVERIAGHARIVANKEATGATDSASEIVQRCPDIALLSGDDSMTLPFGSVGGVGVVSVISNIVPDRMSRLAGMVRDRELNGALKLHQEVFNLCRAMFLETNPIPVKAALEMMGVDTGALRLPMTPATDSTRAVLKRVLTELSLL
jgi:4-hydroxy-tetrahydrodipicolinate synthase